MNRKKLSAVLTAGALALSMFTACGKENDPNTTDNADTQAQATEAAEGPVSVKDTHTNDEIRDITAAELVSEMKIGWNLGNTLDATNNSEAATQPSQFETAWGNPVTSKAMIDLVKDAGFNVLRVPVTWEQHLGEGPDYTIDEAWLDRVQEVVNYGIDNDMFVILNLHHEEWHMPTYDNLDAATEELTAVWTQIADRFGGYDEHLIFEGMNEPRLKGTPLEWSGGDEEARDCINQLNATFVSTIRASGKNNDKRSLMIPTYAASSDDKVLKDFVVPEDDRIIVSIHAYTPYNFALADNGTTEWSADKSSDTNDIDLVFARLKDKFLDKGIPVVIGEFGSRNRFNLEARCAHATYYVSKAKEYGIPCVWWDNGAFVGNGENFGLLVRNELRWHDPEIIDALMKGLE
ncbi:MAG: glycoside hydrolase family 5 protein [Oscillospiraceae bacterium]